ncbi:MAG TPA: PAS domain S-box protein, partial [Actinomycetota bacterium]|nr:PAS domain S-box protein [Actinomycetota bacterium]
MSLLHEPIRHVTDESAVEERLLASQRFLDAAQAASHIGSFDLELVTKDMSWSNEQFRIFGHEPGSIDVDYATFLNGIYPDDRARVDDEVKKGDSGSGPFVMECRILRADGSIRWIRGWGGFLSVSRSGTHLLASVQDVTEQRRAQKEHSNLLRREQHLSEEFRLLLESTSDGIVGLDENGTCSFANQAASEMLGRAPLELLGKGWHEHCHHSKSDGSLFPAEECRIQRAVRDGIGTIVEGEIFWRADGTSFPVDYSAQPIMKAGQAIGAVVTFSDVTERQRAAQALDKSQALLQALVEHSPAVIYVKEGAGGKYLLANSEYLEAFGLRLDQVVGQTDREIFPPETAELLIANDRRVLAEGAMQFEESALHVDGKMHSYVSLKFPLDVGGRQRELCGISTDITDQIESHNEKRRLETELVQAQKMEAVGLLAGGVAHDFNNILSVILNYADFIAEDMTEDDERRADVQQIITAGHRAAKLVRQLLTFSRKEIIEPRVVDLNEIIRGVYELLRRSIGEDIRIELETSPDLWPTKSDTGQIEQILVNLAVNARDAMPKGGTIQMATSNETIATGDRLDLPPGRYARITVTDEGTGIDPAAVDRIFEPFFTTKERDKGSGLGLSTVFGIVKQAGGGVYVDPREGRGTSFSVFLPATPEPLPGPA